MITETFRNSGKPTSEPTTDPRRQGPKPDFDESSQERTPGLSADMNVQPDYGEESYRGSGKLLGKKALITGADSGIGRAVALAFAREGADIAISYLDEDEDARETERLVSSAGRKSISLPGDIEQVAHCQQLIEQTVSAFGSIDILVNNAAFQMSHESVEELTPEEWDKTMRTNISAMFYLSRAALATMKEGGIILNTTSVQAYQPSPQLLAYATTKGAIVTFTKALAQVAIRQGIRVNAVAPGPVWTPLIPATMPEEKLKQFGKTSPIERPAQPAELAPMYVFLASNDARYITGGIFDVTGGKMLP